MKPSRLLAWTRMGLRAVAAGYLCALLGLVLWGSAPMAWGWRPTLVVGGSMGPTVHRGDLLVTALARVPADLRDGQVIVFDGPDGRSVAHRIAGRDSAGNLVTRGDANAEADSVPVPATRVRGVTRMVVPAIGRPVLWLREGSHLKLGLWLAVTVLAGGAAFQGRRPSAGPPAPLSCGSA